MIFFALVNGRPYHAVEIRDLAAGKIRQTHVEVMGWVRYVAREADGDLHIRICDGAKVEGMDRTRCLVAECLPWHMCSRPRLGAHVTVRGISRFDNENGHLWAEIHPVDELKVVP